MKRINKINQGFTLIELLVVIAVLGILAAGVLTAINPLKRIQQANDAELKSDIGQIAVAMQAYYTTTAGNSSVAYYPREVSSLVPGDLKVEPRIPPARLTQYSVTGSQSTPSTACTTADTNCVNITVYATLNETGVGYWCWESETGKIGKIAAAPAATDTSCGIFL